MIQLAIAGFGNIGRVHATNLTTMRGCRLAGVFDPRLATVADPELKDVRSYDSMALLLTDREVDAVIVATPAQTHRAIVESALVAGKHVFCEKPLSTNLDDAQAMVDAAAAHPELAAQAGFCERFNPHYIEAKRAVAAGIVGDIRAIQSSRVAPRALGDPRWELGVLDTAVHNLDLILWLTGELPDRVRSTGVRIYPEQDMLHSVNTVLKFPSGALATDHIAWLDDGGHPLHDCARSRMSIMGTKGVFEVELTGRPASILTADSFREIDTVILGAPEYYSCLRLQFEAFLQSIEDHRPVAAPFTDALAAERVVLAAARSLATGSEVSL